MLRPALAAVLGFAAAAGTAAAQAPAAPPVTDAMLQDPAPTGSKSCPARAGWAARTGKPARTAR